MGQPTAPSRRFFVNPLLLALCACPMATLSQGDGGPSQAAQEAGQASEAATGAAPTAAAGAALPAAAADPTAAGAMLSSPNAVPSPNRIIIGDAAPGVATGSTVAAGSKPATATATEPNATKATPAAASPNVASPASPNAVAAPVGSQTPPSTATPVAPNTGLATAAAWPNIAFNKYAGKLGSKVVALTFDDGPDGQGTGQNNTAGILDFLQANGLKATFFVCGKVWTDLSTDAAAIADLKRIVAEGHDIGSHTYTHPHLDTIAAADIDAQFGQNLTVVRGILGRTFSFDKIRAPFGFPFQTNNPNVFWVAPVAAKYGVHIGWGIDTDDWKCAQNGQDSNCIMNNLKAQVAAGASGPMLMHSVYQLTLKTLPQAVAYLQAEGYRFVTAEQMVVDKYGKSSAQLMAAAAASHYTSAQIGAAAASECKNNATISVVY